ncbi:hypothetical protein HD806DRAFT_544079 [Xylariaceae sp. AK1471]|nr:hypothetical protein HD806DRAFT_544079 [Xylariaceae sp. AK1471]
MPRAKADGLESYEDIPMNHPQRRKIQNRNAQRTFRKKRAAGRAQSPVPKSPLLPSSPQSSLSPGKNGVDLQQQQQLLHESLDLCSRTEMDTDILSFLDHPPELDTFLDDVDLEDHSMANLSDGSLQTLNQGKKTAHQAFDWQQSRAHPTQNRNPHTKTYDNNQFTKSQRSDPPSRSSTRLHLLNSPFPIKNSNRAQSRAVRPTSSRRESHQAFISLTAPSIVSQQRSPTEAPNKSRSGSLQNFTPTNAPGQGNGAGPMQEPAPAAVGLLSPSQCEGTLGTINLSTGSGSADAERGQSADTWSDESTADPSSASSKLVLVWRHLIHTCCENGHLSLIEELLDAGLDIDKKDSAGNTPLHIAAGAGHIDVMRYLIEKGCNVNAINDAGWTAAHLASIGGHRGCLRLLLEKNISPWARLSVQDI